MSQISPPSLKLLCQISRYSKGKVVDKPAFVLKLKRHGPCVSFSPRWTRDLCRMSLGLGWTILLMKMGARAAARAQPPGLSHQGLFCSLCVSCLLLYNKLPRNLVFPKQQRFISSQFEWVWLVVSRTWLGPLTWVPPSFFYGFHQDVGYNWGVI